MKPLICSCFLLVILHFPGASAQLQDQIHEMRMTGDGMQMINAPPQNITILTESPRKQTRVVEAKPDHFKKHAVVMLAINYSEGEIEAARTAAIARGEQFILLPEMTKEVKEGAKMAYEIERIEHRTLRALEDQAMDAKNPKEQAAILARVKIEQDKVTKIRDKVEALKLREQKMGSILEKKVLALEKAGVGVDALVISAHDGGGHFGGTFGSTSRNEIIEIANKDPRLQGSLRSVFMLGCYTATTDEAREWKLGFPNLELVGGYDQAAPLRDAPKGWNYVRDLMISQKKLTHSKDLMKLNKIANAVTDINKSGAAFATFPKCADPKLQREFYRGEVTNGKVLEFDPKMCMEAKEQFIQNQILYNRY